MSKKPAKEILFKELTSLAVDIIVVDIQKNSVLKREVSGLYFKEYSVGQEQEYDSYLNKLYKAFFNEINAELAEVRNPVIFLETLNDKVREVEVSFSATLEIEEEKINDYPIPISLDAKDFFNDMAAIQEGYISKVSSFIEQKLQQLSPKESSESIEINNGGLTLDFNLGRNEVVALFLLLQDAGVINNKSVAKFLNTYVKWREFDGNDKPVYNRVTDASNPIWKLKNNDVETDDIITKLKGKINTANIKRKEN
ncbi:hypothetical protein ABID22_003827 [Pontibacter aydingkolensis]|uniref:Uncharacterized protein n=1 Tax=Pontibacter aydingkolensis TaxID=1911536 RepID=A0ABS7CZ75_9BACT|nr:hypothetical protein [Pontibacter aydingkolensis]MBW7469132.1 hypothetical protein [Pontibacter aydingkolensis]